MAALDTEPLRAWLLDLQDRICASLEASDGAARFAGEPLEGERGGLARPRVLADGACLERAAVHVSHTRGPGLPAAATERRPELAGRPFEAVSLSAIVHPRNPYAPTSHLNVRAFVARAPEGSPDAAPIWWFGGGFDLTPCYGFEEDAVHWHRTARAALEPHGAELYPRFKEWCDRYFFLPHRGEPRGIGGIFFDDFDELGYDGSRAMWRDVGEAFLDAYLPILERRKATPFGEREREFQLLRRGRYVEFNLLHDRGTRYGLQAGGRAESILASLPPLVRWHHDWRPEPGSAEARLFEVFLRPRDWASEVAG